MPTWSVVSAVPDIYDVWCKQLRRIQGVFSSGALVVGQKRVHFLTGQLYRSVVGEEGLEKIGDLIDAIGAHTSCSDRSDSLQIFGQHDVASTYGDSIVDGARNHSRCC